MLTHIMLDLETWGTSAYSTIVMIGACAFDPFTHEDAKIVVDRFEVAIDPTSCRGLLHIDAKTLMWWMAAEREPARAIWLGQSKVPLHVALDGFADWLRSLGSGEEKDLRIWGNGSDFDNVLLRQAYEVAKRDVPWGYWHNRCFRTLCNLTRVDAEKGRFLGTAHTALADAENQAILANRIVRQLGIDLT